MSASFDSYKIFYYVGKYKNITHAASALFLSQSTVTRTIQSLEAELGCKLFDRTRYGVSFTNEGNSLYEHIAKACEEIFLGEEKILQMQQISQSTLRIGISDFAFSQFVLPVLKSFHLDFPSVKIEVISNGFCANAEILNALLNEKIDLACTAVSLTDDFKSAPIDIVPVASYTDVIIASRKYPELRSGSYHFSDLSGYPFISLTSSESMLSYLDKLFLANGMHISPDFQVDSLYMFIPILKECDCLAVIPSLLRDLLIGDNSFFEVQMIEPLPSHNVNIITSKRAPQSAVRDAFARQLRKHFESKISNMGNHSVPPMQDAVII